jgi:hypothetical protein
MILLGGPSGRSWEQFKIIIEPVEFYNIIKEHEIYIFKSGQISDNYNGSTKDELIQTYSNYWENIISGERYNYEIDKFRFKRFIITDNVQDIEIAYLAEKGIKIIKDIKPVIWLDSFSLLYKDFRLFTDETFFEGNVGINFIFPKKIGYYNNGQMDYQDTESLSNSKLYKKITHSLLENVNRIKISNETKVFKPNVYISDSARDKINKNYYLVENKLIIK